MPGDLTPRDRRELLEDAALRAAAELIVTVVATRISAAGAEGPEDPRAVDVAREVREELDAAIAEWGSLP